MVVECDPISVIGIIGAGSWGTALAVLFAQHGCKTRLVARDAERANELSADRENRRYLEGMMFPDAMSVHHDANIALSDVDCVLIAVPSVAMREVMERYVGDIPSRNDSYQRNQRARDRNRETDERGYCRESICEPISSLRRGDGKRVRTFRA